VLGAILLLVYLAKLWPLADLIGTSHAASPAAESSDTHLALVKQSLNVVLFAVMALAFLWTLFVSLHSRVERRAKTAIDLNKMLLGFIIGSLKSFLIT
jgi:hypothetical protein